MRFCSGTPVVAEYFAEDFRVEPFSGDKLEQVSTGNWAACSTCRMLIDSGNWDRVAHRAVNSFMEKYPGIDTGGLFMQLEALYKDLGEHGFRKVRNLEV